VAAFGVDLAIVTAPAIGVWVYVAETLPGSPSAEFASVRVDVAALGYAAWAFVALVLSEWALGATPGKRVLGLRVRDRTLGPAPPLALLLRNLPKLVPLTIIGIVGAVGAYLLVRGGGLAQSVNAGPVSIPPALFELAGLLASVGVALALCAAVSGIAILFTAERQRIGDLLAGTFVTLD
jgi:uncharacterized RDD family membrane protein YckC